MRARGDRRPGPRLPPPGADAERLGVRALLRERVLRPAAQGRARARAARLMAGGEEAERERAWLRETLYADITAVLREHGSGKRRARRRLRPGRAAPVARRAGLRGARHRAVRRRGGARPRARARRADRDARGAAGGVRSAARHTTPSLLLNVLEHVPDPGRDAARHQPPARAGRPALHPRARTTSTRSRLAAQRSSTPTRGGSPMPDHVNYFDVESLCALSRRSASSRSTCRPTSRWSCSC